MRIDVSRSLKSHISKTEPVRGCAWYVYTPQGEHYWAPDWRSAMSLGNRYAREAQQKALRDS